MMFVGVVMVLVVGRDQYHLLIPLIENLRAVTHTVTCFYTFETAVGLAIETIDCSMIILSADKTRSEVKSGLLLHRKLLTSIEISL